MNKTKALQLLFVIIITAPISIPILLMISFCLLVLRVVDKEVYNSIRDDEYEQTGVY